MAEYGAQRREVSSWAIGFTGFAAFMLMLTGVFHMLIGISGIARDDVFVTTPEYLFQFDLTTWGWIHLIAGLVVLLAGISLFTGAVWARTIGVLVALASMIANFAFLPYYPLWAVLIIAVDIAVIWALTTHGRDIAMEH